MKRLSQWHIFASCACDLFASFIGSDLEERTAGFEELGTHKERLIFYQPFCAR